MLGNTVAAFWSAVAASFSALSSFLIFCIHRRNLLESVRPELVLMGWTRGRRGQGETMHEFISFQTLKNVGRGMALRIVLNLSNHVTSPPTALLSTTGLPILAP